MTQVTLTITDEMIEAGFCTGMPEEFDVIFNKDIIEKIIHARKMMADNTEFLTGDTQLEITECFDVPAYKNDISFDKVFINAHGNAYIAFNTDENNETLEINIDNLLTGYATMNHLKM